MITKRTPLLDAIKFDARAGWNVSDLHQDSSWRFSLNDTARNHLREMIIAAFDPDRPFFDYHADEFDLGPAHQTIKAALDMAHHGLGIALLGGLPRDGISEKEFELLNWAIGLQFGVARPQGIASQYISQVRDVGTDYRAKTGRGYSSNAKLDFHSDGCDLVTLACYNKARSGGQEYDFVQRICLANTVRRTPGLGGDRASQRILFQPTKRNRPPMRDLFIRSRCSTSKDGRLFAKWNRNRVRTAQQIEGRAGTEPGSNRGHRLTGRYPVATRDYVYHVP